MPANGIFPYKKLVTLIYNKYHSKLYENDILNIFIIYNIKKIQYSDFRNLKKYSIADN